MIHNELNQFLWGGRFAKAPSEAFQDFTNSLPVDHRLAAADIKGSLAHARMLKAQGLLSEKEHKDIEAGLKAIAVEISDGSLPIQGAEDIHTFIELELTKRVGDAGKKLHTGRSRNDQIALDEKLYLIDAVGAVLGKITALQTTLLNRAQQEAETPMPGYTHLQKAQVISVGFHLLAYVNMLERDAERFSATLARCKQSPLGAGALAGSSLPLDPSKTAKELGMDAPPSHALDAVADRDCLLEVLSNSATLMMHSSRLAEEVVLWASKEFSFITLPDEFSSGSSFLPQKKNPDLAELIRGKTGRVYGNLVNLLVTMKGLPLAYNRDLQEDKWPLFDTIDTVLSTLTLWKEFFDIVKFDRESMRRSIESGFLQAIDLAEYLVAKGVPFREAHKIVGQIVAHCAERNIPLDAIDLVKLKSFSEKFEGDVRERLEVSHSLKYRQGAHTPNPQAVLSSIRLWQHKLAKRSV